jgi:hypothetical protein
MWKALATGKHFLHVSQQQDSFTLQVNPRSWPLKSALHAVPYNKMLSATILERLPLFPRVLRLVQLKKGGVALAIHTFKSRPGRPADLRYLRLVLITEVHLISTAKCPSW